MSHLNRHTIAAQTPTTKMNGNNSNIPLRRNLGRQSSSPGNQSKIPINDPQTHRWKQKYEEAEERRKNLLSEKERALRSLKEVEKKHLNLQIKHEHLETELFEKNEEYSKLSTASKNLYKEYETLKNQYETETRAMSGALKDATQWYRENRELKRKTLLLTDKDAVDEGVDAGDGVHETDIENLNKTIKQLSSEIAELQTEVDALKQSEFQANEDNVRLAEDLENEKSKTERLESTISELSKENEQMQRVMEMLRNNLEEYKKLDEDHREQIIALRKESDGHKRERNVLAHQSTLILQGLGEDCEGNLMLLQEIEELKRTIEDERNKHEEEISNFQDRLEDAQNPDQNTEILEERLKLVESELQSALERAERAEGRLKVAAAPPAPPPPPPPPPLPPPMPPAAALSDPPRAPLRRRRSKVSMQEVVETIDVQEGEKKPPAPGVNSDIIQAIKQGQFTLRKAKSDKQKKKEEPKAVSELLNILGSLRRAPKKRQSQFFGDVQL